MQGDLEKNVRLALTNRRADSEPTAQPEGLSRTRPVITTIWTCLGVRYSRLPFLTVLPFAIAVHDPGFPRGRIVTPSAFKLFGTQPFDTSTCSANTPAAKPNSYGGLSRHARYV
jgi:hypothetical protein